MRSRCQPSGEKNFLQANWASEARISLENPLFWQGNRDNLDLHAKELDFVRAYNLALLSAPVYAFYNPPWTLPFLRRNEIIVEIARPQG